VRAVLAMTLLLTLAACGTPGDNVSGTADYDSLRRATQACEITGGKLVLKDQGDAQYIQDYVCKGK
jgi:hypothetical protein